MTTDQPALAKPHWSRHVDGKTPSLSWGAYPFIVVPALVISGMLLYAWQKPRIKEYQARRRQRKGMGGWPQPSRADMMHHRHNASEEELVGYYKR
ncbi:hypothetical protein PG993_011706 [Apiospora rasikravindrae]|uniref:Uncharacterized protein n=1 Tax=Apiospora rasikravindrae TaxID=990691 RepID=A0ABR1S0D2_9PEZI